MSLLGHVDIHVFSYDSIQLACHFRLVRPKNRFLDGRIRGVRYWLFERSRVHY